MMSFNIQLHLPILTLVILSAGARPLDGDPVLPSGELLVFFQLPAERAANVVLFVPSKVADYEEPSHHSSTDPNVVLMLEHLFQASEWAGNAPRSTRADPLVQQYHSSTDSYVDLYYLSRRPKWSTEQHLQAPSPALQPPPMQQPSRAVPANKVGRSISTADLSPNQPDVGGSSSDEENPDFLSTLVTIPQVWMHDLSHMIIQPLRKDKNPSAERDSYEYFGMVGKAPYITCPLGFKKNTLGTCRPVFRSKRDSPSLTTAPKDGRQ